MNIARYDEVFPKLSLSNSCKGDILLLSLQEYLRNRNGQDCHRQIMKTFVNCHKPGTQSCNRRFVKQKNVSRLGIGERLLKNEDAWPQTFGFSQKKFVVS